jgi:hypothetical protein
LIVTLLITIFTESIVIIGYSHWREKRLAPILITSITGNLLTQSLLWIALNLFFQNYLLALLIAEIFIWIIETVLLYSIPANELSLGEASLLSLGMNALSVAVGWLLPV